MLKRIVLTCLIGLVITATTKTTQAKDTITKKPAWWSIQAIDTVKYSRDLAREKLQDDSFDNIINQQIKNIASTGATHVAIGTPYDSEFIPYLKKWVNAAHANNLNVWLRGNFSGWEKWFEYDQITRSEHIQRTKDFILNNKDIFVDGDIFTPCPECENGGPGDPRFTGDVTGFRNFLINEYKVTQEAFKQIGKDVRTNLASMNGDVADLIMDKDTTKALGGVVTIDHYVKSPDDLAKDIQLLSIQSGGKVVLGEFGAPIPDIHGNLTQKQQAEWIKNALSKLSQMPELEGLNYWTYNGSSTQLWNGDGSARTVVDTLTSFYTPNAVVGRVINALGQPVSYTKIYAADKLFISDDKGNFTAVYLDENPLFTAKATGYKDQLFPAPKDGNPIEITLTKEHESIFFKAQKLLHKLLDEAREEIKKLTNSQFE